MMIQTTQRVLPVVCGTSSTTGYQIEVDKLLSQANSKLYRQGMNYHVKLQVSRAQESTQDRSYKIFVLPKDHRTIGALRMARSIYNQAMKDELEIRPEVKSAWTDFKIQPVVGANVSWTPMVQNAALMGQRVAGGDLAGVTAYGISDNYAYSEITANNGDQRKFSLVTATSGYPDAAWNCFIEYNNFLLNRADPDSSLETAAYGDASPVLTEMQELADKGDEPPYSWGNKMKETIGGSEQSDLLNLTLAGVLSSDQNPRSQLSITVEAPLGLIFVQCDDAMSTTLPEIVVHVTKGNYKGVKADRLYPKDKLLGF